MDAFHKGIQYTLEKLGKSKFGFERTVLSNFKSKIHEGSGNELVDYCRASCLGADQKHIEAEKGTRRLWERDCKRPDTSRPTHMRDVEQTIGGQGKNCDIVVEVALIYLKQR